MRVPDLSSIKRVKNLKHLAVRWNTKLENITAISDLPLHSLALEDTPKVNDLAPIQTLAQLEHFTCSGGHGRSNSISTLEPIAQAQALKFLTLTNVRVLNDGLLPLARCSKIESLEVSNQFRTEECAYLSVHLPAWGCAVFSAYITTEPIKGVPRVRTRL